MEECKSNKEHLIDQTVDECSAQPKEAKNTSRKKGIKNSMSGYNHLTNQVEPSTSLEENDADKLIEENNKLREQNLKLQKILAIAGVKFDGESEASGPGQQPSVTYTPASSTFSSDIQDLNVTGGCQQGGGSDDDYGSVSNDNVECSTDVVTKSSKSKRNDEDRSSGSEILLCDTSTNIDFAPLPEDQSAENDLFAELQVDTTVDIRPKSSSYEDHRLTITLPSQSNESDIKVNSQIIRPGTSYLNPDGIVDISPPLPLTDHNCFPGSSVLSPNAQSSAPAFSVPNCASQNLSMFGQQPSLSMANGAPVLNIQRMDSGMQLGGPLSLVGGFNNGILINQQVSFLPQHQQPQNILLNPNSGIMNSQAKILSPNGNILPQNGNLITHQGNLLMQNGNGIFQQFAQPVSSLNLIPQATPLFSGSQMKATPVHGPMTLNVVPQNTGRDFLMLPNGKLVPISTQPSILPVAPSHPAMQSIITGFSNQIRFQTPQFLGGNSIQRCSQPFNLLPPHQMPLLGPPDQSRLTGQNQISVNGLPVLAPGQLPQTLQIFNQLPQVSPQQNIGNSSMAGPHTVIPPQNFVFPNVQPCMTAYLTPEGTIVLSLHQQTAKKVVEDVQKSSQSVNNNFLQEKKVQRRIMPKPPTNDSILNSNLSAISSTKCSTLNCHVAASSSSNDANDILDKGNNTLAAPGASSAYPSGDYARKSLQTGLETGLEALSQNHDDVTVRKKGSGRKRELGCSEKKKRVKAIPKSETASGVIGILNATPEKSDLSELQDISCCILNESLSDHFAQNLNDDDQGDINQFSDLIVMDNEVTSNPKTNLDENILPTTSESSQKNPEDSVFICESLPETMSVFSVSSTTASCSENVVFPSSSNADGNNSVAVHEKKVKKKKKKVNTTGLLTIEPIAEVMFQKSSPPAHEMSCHLDDKCEDRKASQDFTRVISSSLVEPSISSSAASDPADGRRLSDSPLISEERKHSSSDSIDVPAVSEQPVAYPVPDRVEEGTQTVKLERRKRNRSNKKSKNKTCSIETSKRECDSNINDAVSDNIPEKLSFLEDQLMDVVDKVESLVAQSVMTSVKDFPDNIDTKYEIKDTQFCKYEDDDLDISKLEPSVGKRKQHITTEDKPVKKLKLSSKGENDFWEIKHSSRAIENHSVRDCSASVSMVNGSGSVCCNALTIGLENSLDSASSRNLHDSSMSEEVTSPVKKGKKQKDVGGDKVFPDGKSDKNSSKQVVLESNLNLVKSMDHIDFASSQTDPKESLTSADGYRSARHTSIASLALSSGNIKVSVTKSNVTKTTKCHQVNEEGTQSEVDCECDLAKAVDSIVEELDKTLHQVKQSVVVQDNLLEISDQKCSGNKKEGSKASNVVSDLDTRESKANQKNESKFVSSESKTSSWSSSSSSNTYSYQTPTTISSSLQRCHSSSDESVSKCSHNKSDSDAPVNNHLVVPSAMPGPSVNACYVGRNKNGHDAAIDSSSKTAELEIYRNDKSSAEKFPASVHSSSYKELNNPPCLKSESNIASEENDKKFQASLLNAISKNNENMMSHNAQNSRQKSSVKMEQQISKPSRQSSESVNMGGTSYYAMDESGKKFGYPNIFAPTLFTDPYSSSCAQFSTFPVSGGASFEPGFMLPPCIPFDGPVASAGFNYYGDSTRYSHFGHSSLGNKNHHSFSSMAPDYPSCSLEPKKMPVNSNFNDRAGKDETLKNKLNNPRKDLFIPPDIPLDQFIMPCASSAEKQNMSQNMDGGHSGAAFMNSGASKSYPASKQDALSGNRNSKSSSNANVYNRNPSNPLVSPPLHHHPLLFDQKNSGFATGFDFSFNSSNLNTLMNGCGIMDQPFVSTVPNSFNNNYNRDCGNTSNSKGISQEEKKVPINKNNSLANNNKMYDSGTKSNAVASSSANLTLTSSSASGSQPKSVSKSTRSSKKASTAKTNTDNNSCMFGQTQASAKCNSNTEVMSYFANNFNSSLPCRTSSSANEASKFQSPYATGSIALSMGGNANNLGLRTSASIGMDYMSTQILGSSGSIHSHHHPHFGFNHFFPEMDIPNGYLKFGNHGVGDLETMPLHHQHKNPHQSSVPNQSPHSVLSDINPFFHPPQYSFDGSSSYFNQSACSASPFTMSSLNIRMPRMYHQNNNTF